MRWKKSCRRNWPLFADLVRLLPNSAVFSESFFPAPIRAIRARTLHCGLAPVRKTQKKTEKSLPAHWISTEKGIAGCNASLGFCPKNVRHKSQSKREDLWKNSDEFIRPPNLILRLLKYWKRMDGASQRQRKGWTYRRRLLETGSPLFKKKGCSDSKQKLIIANRKNCPGCIRKSQT